MPKSTECSVLLKVWGISYSDLENEAYTLFLKEAYGERNLPIIIGKTEAHSISTAIHHKEGKRPTSHDLMMQICQASHSTLQRVNIIHCIDNIYYTELVFENEGNEITLKARTSDAVALAVRMDSPIYIKEALLQERAVYLEAEEKIEEGDESEDWEGDEAVKFSLRETRQENASSDSNSLNKREDLQRKLEEALKKENYEQASILRDLIKNLSD